MNKKLKKILATVSAVAMCAVSMTAINSNALYIYNSAGINQYTVSFTFNGLKYVVWQEMNDYFDNENWKFFISEDGTQNIFLHDEEISLWNFGEYYLENKEDAVSLKKYLSDNNIQYTEGTILEHTIIQLTRDVYEEEEHKPLYIGNEYFQLIQKIKEDTGFIQGIYVLANTTITEVTNVENTLPEPTLSGDANEDGDVNMADAVLIMQTLSNPDEYKLTPQGMANADIAGYGDGVTAMDALTIQLSIINQ